MKRTSKLLCACALPAALGVAGPAQASSHREAPAITEDPAADNTDLWAWVEPGTHNKLHVVAAFIPMEEPSGGPNWHKFSDDVLYEVHIARGKDSLADVVTYQFRFTSGVTPRVDVADMVAPAGGGKEFFRQLAAVEQSYTVTKIVAGQAPQVLAATTPAGLGQLKVAPPNFGPRSYSVLASLGAAEYAASTAYDNTFAGQFVTNLANGERVWAGPRDDGFYADLGGIFDLANLRAAGTAKDNVAGYNCHAISLEIPTDQLTGTGAPPTPGAGNAQTLGVWSSSSRRKVTVRRAAGKPIQYGAWTQVSRLGLPLINEAVIGLQDKDKFNRTRPQDDLNNFGSYFLNPIIVRDAEVVGVYGAGVLAPPAVKSNRMDLIALINLNDQPAAASHSIATIGDVLRVDLGVDSAFPNGRPLRVNMAAAANKEGSDVTDVLLSFLLLGANAFPGGTPAVQDGVNYNDGTYLAAMPWLPLPWNSYNQGHGSTTP